MTLKMITRALQCEVRGTDAADGGDKKSFRFTASTDSIDRYGEIVKQDWDLKGFNSNPVILWAHSSEHPIGKGVAEMVDGKLMVDITFHGLTEKSAEIEKLVDAGYLNMVSVGFRPKSVKFEKIDGKDVPVLSGNELLEISVVSIGANQDALGERAYLKSLADCVAVPELRKEHTMLSEIRKALGLADTITDEQVVDAIKSLGTAADDLVAFVTLTGTDGTDAARGVITAWKDAAERVPVLEKQIADRDAADAERVEQARVAAENDERKSILDMLRAEKRATPAQLAAFETESVLFLRSFAKTAPKLAVFEDIEQPTDDQPRGARRYEDMTHAELEALALSDRSEFDRLRNDFRTRKGFSA